VLKLAKRPITIQNNKIMNKFEGFESDTPDNPVVEIMDSWLQANFLYEENFDEIQGLNRATRIRVDQDSSLEYTVEFEIKLREQLPKLCDELERLKRSLDKVYGWQITFKKSDDPDIWEGCWVAGSRVGVDRVLGGLNAWVEVSPRQDIPRGIGIQLGDMSAITLTPSSFTSD
jgi:hypothetical protein